MTKALLHPLGQSLSFGRLSILAKVIWPMLLSTSDDQGRGTAEADAIKWYVCPNVPEITVDNVTPLLEEMQTQGMILLYQCNGKGLVYQIVRWWEYQRLNWARPSKYAPPAGWVDRIRYSDRGDMTVVNWDDSGGFPEGFCIENYIENSAENQPNLTKPNLTKLKEEKDGAKNAPAMPSSYPEWLTMLKESKNKTAGLVFMYRTLYGQDGEKSDFGRFGKLVKTAGSYSSLANLLWMNATKGLASPIDYITKAVNNNGKHPAADDGWNLPGGASNAY